MYPTAKFNFLNVCYVKEDRATSFMSSQHRHYSASPSSTQLETAKHAHDVLEEIKIPVSEHWWITSACQQNPQKSVLTPGVCQGQSGGLSNCGHLGQGWLIDVLLSLGLAGIS